MKKTVFSAIIALFVQLSVAQNVFTFEQLSLPSSGYWNGSDQSVYTNGFGYDVLFFNNFYVSSYDYFEGFAFSNWTNTTQNGYENQWSVFTGSARSGQIFGLGYVPINFALPDFPTVPIVLDFEQKVKLDSLFITNSTYTALTIQQGSAYSQPFNIGDSYKIIIRAYKDNAFIDSVVVFLAQYTETTTFVANQWLKVDFSNLNDSINKLTFDAITTDVGVYGPNTPLYFCIDDIYYSIKTTSIKPNNKLNLAKISPNPAFNYICLDRDAENIEVFDINGKKVLELSEYQSYSPIHVGFLATGVYFVRLSNFEVAKFIKN